MSYTVDNEFLFAIRTARNKRSKRELRVIYSLLRHLEAFRHVRENQLLALCSLVRYEFHSPNTTLFREDDLCNCWYILLRGAVFIQGSMFLPFQSFGKRVPNTKRRGYQCEVLEPSEMIAVDYPDVMCIQTAGEGTRPHALRRTTSLENALTNHVDVDTSSSEKGSPLHSTQESIQSGSSQPAVMSDNLSQLSFPRDIDDDESTEADLDEEDTLSIHSGSSLFPKDIVIDVLKKEIDERTNDDIETLMEFTKSLRAFSNLTEPIRRSLCKVMVFAWVEHADTVVLKDNELLDSWSVIINGQVLVRYENCEEVLVMGDSFGVQPTLQAQHQRGKMTTTCEECQFLCIAQQDYFDVLHQGEENIEKIKDENGEVVMVKEKREFENGAKKGNIAIRGTAESLMKHMLEENAIDTTYIEDFLLTYRVFNDEPLRMCSKLLEWFDAPIYRDKVVKIILLWVNNHFKDFESDWRMMDLLEKFDEKLQQRKMQGHKLFNMAFSANAKPRVVTINKISAESDLEFKIVGGSDCEWRNPIYICSVTPDSTAEKKGVKRGDQLMEVNGQNFEKISFENAQTILNKNTDLTLTLKTNLFAFKELMTELKNPTPKKHVSKMMSNGGDRSNTLRLPTLSASSEPEVFETSTKHTKKGGTLGRATRKISRIFKREPNSFSDFLIQHGESPFGPDERSSMSAIDGAGRSNSYRPPHTLSNSVPDFFDPSSDCLYMHSEAPDDVIKVYRADQSFRFLYVSKDTTAGDAVRVACKEFGITEELENCALYRVSVQGEKFVKQSKLPDPWSKLPDIPLGSRYYLKNTMNSEQLLPDENIPELLKEGNFTFLDLDCFEIANYLTKEDYKLFQRTEPSNFIDDLFQRGSQSQLFKDFVDLVNRELFWVVTTVCSEPNLVLRSKIIKHFIKIAHHCKNLKNFNSTFALISGLGYRAVSKLKQAWEKVPAKSVRLFEELQSLMDPSRNMSKYRTLLSEASHLPPVIPYVPVVMKDLTFIHLGNDTNVEDLINFEKMRMISKEIRNICRLCVPDASQILPDFTSPKDSDKAIYQRTLARKGRRGSLNNARRMYESAMNIRRVKQYMQQITVITDEEKLMEMSKIVESQQGPSANQQKRKVTATNTPADSPTPSTPTRNTLDSNQARSTETLAPATKKKSPFSTLPRYLIDANSSFLGNNKQNSDEARNKKLKNVSRSLSMNSREKLSLSSPKLNQVDDKALNEIENNNVIGYENLNVNNNRHDIIAAGSNNSLDSLTSRLSGRSKKNRSTKSEGSSGRGSLASSASLGIVYTSSPSISSSGVNSSSSPLSLRVRKSQSNTAPPNLMNSQRRKTIGELPTLMTAADLAMAADSFQIGQDTEGSEDHSSNSTPTHKSVNGHQPISRSDSRDSGIAPGDSNYTEDNGEEEIFGSVDYPNAPLPARKTQILSDGPALPPRNFKQLSASSNEECDPTTFKQNSTILRHKDESKSNVDPCDNIRASLLLAMTNGPNQCCDITEADAVYPDPTSPLSYPHLSEINHMGRRTLTSRKAVKTIHEFVYERHVAAQNQRSGASRASIFNPLMRPNYTNNMAQGAVESNRDSEHQRRQRLRNAINSQSSASQTSSCEDKGSAKKITSSLYPSGDSRYPANSNIHTPNIKPALHPITSYTPPSASSKDEPSPYENDYDEFNPDVGERIDPCISPPAPPHARSPRTRIHRQVAVEHNSQNDGSNPTSVTSPSRGLSEDYVLHSSRPKFEFERHVLKSAVSNDQPPPPPPKRTTSIGRPNQLRNSVESPITSPTSSDLTSPLPNVFHQQTPEDNLYTRMVDTPRSNKLLTEQVDGSTESPHFLSNGTSLPITKGKTFSSNQTETRTSHLYPSSGLKSEGKKSKI